MSEKARKALRILDFRHKKRRPLTSIDVPMVPKAGLEHRNYPYDLKRLKFTTFDMIPSLIPSDPIGDNRTL
ncbi:hypothetical protein F3Y20_13515 [Klebsiella pneumoniae]|nr:hypothetical protein EI552_23865 [Klebsiella pneumoniae]KAA8871394.1 hypothetical protein F3Y20_13515 [Klebsiella pneumoniae]MCI3161440.1 hypothetical protein [Klebsiella pneumoniae]MCI3173196.1 hypothetical protein [Klebsiella pneumoniae]MCI3189302.1 hypothetical protein [Klebsiella pneumoniae]